MFGFQGSGFRTQVYIRIMEEKLERVQGCSCFSKYVFRISLSKTLRFVTFKFVTLLVLNIILRAILPGFGSQP